ncbi:hypothetical protein [Deinococcus kurensis]|uniref:hypothetical protein n=1 Tax=Deinococcus kurensis TaxID=2662757 RepID=UPI0012D35BA7|nr:hypothetical protein [Deinococcus kurensis]
MNWTPITELPATPGTYLVTTDQGAVTIATFTPGKPRGAFSLATFSDRLPPVTHWAPLPAPAMDGPLPVGARVQVLGVGYLRGQLGTVKAQAGHHMVDVLIGAGETPVRFHTGEVRLHPSAVPSATPDFSASAGRHYAPLPDDTRSVRVQSAHGHVTVAPAEGGGVHVYAENPVVVQLHSANSFTIIPRDMA